MGEYQLQLIHKYNIQQQDNGFKLILYYLRMILIQGRFRQVEKHVRVHETK